MLTSIQLHQIAAQAANWCRDNPGPLTPWTPGDPWPEVGTGTPVRRVVEDELRLRITPDPLLRAIALRQVHDPDEVSAWRFVPGPEGVLLVHTKPGAPIGSN